MKITLTNEKKSIGIEVKETAVCIQVTDLGDQMLVHVEEHPMMTQDEPGWTRTEMTCKWKRVTSATVVEPHTHTPWMKTVSEEPFCHICGKRIEVVE